MAPCRRLLLAVAVTALTASLAPPLAAQAVLSDYENSDANGQVRAKAIWRLAFRPGVQVLGQTVASLRQTSGLSKQDAATIDALISQAQTASDSEARPLLWHAASIGLGKKWTPAQAAFGSIAIRPSGTVLTNTQAAALLEQQYPVEVPQGIHFAIDLVKGVEASSATPERGDRVRELASGSLSGRFPRSVRLDLSGVAPGFYLLDMHLTNGRGDTGELAAPVYVEPQIEAEGKAVEVRLRNVAGHDAARATALYPFELARALNAGRREVISYDFNRAIARSDEIASALVHGHDPVFQATGLQNRAYRFAETGELIPYQIYVPSNWNPARKWPLVVALHGANLDETNMLGRASGEMQKLAEQHGYIVVAPLGYRINSAYGNTRGIGKQLGADPDRVRRSEADVLSVIDLVTKEYNVDPAHMYLTGNSMGGGGTWWIAAHHPGMFAAIAPTAFGGVVDEDVNALRKVPILAVVGEKDELGMRDRVKRSADLLRANGADIEYLEIPGGTHKTAFDDAMARIFEFFASHGK